MELFKIEDYKPIPTDEFIATQYVQDLYKLAYNKGSGDHDGRKRLRASKELAYVYFLCSFKSEFSNYPDAERDQEALAAAGLPDDYEISGELMSLIGAYTHHITKGNRVLKMLNSSRKLIDKLDTYFNNVSFEIDPGDPLDIQEKKTNLAGRAMDNLNKLPQAIKNLDIIEERVRKEQKGSTKTKGDAEGGRL